MKFDVFMRVAFAYFAWDFAGNSLKGRKGETACRCNNLDVDVRFDIVAIVVDKNNEHRIDHIENAFYPMLSRRR